MGLLTYLKLFTSLYLILQDVHGQIVLNTWGFGKTANEVAWDALQRTDSPLDAVELGCNVCETKKNPSDCDGSVGWGSHPDEHGETTLDAMIFDGTKMSTGAVANLKHIKKAISVARFVMNSTQHSLLVGQSATDFGHQMGFTIESLSSPVSNQDYHQWKSNNCQPNYWKNVQPDPAKNCGPYQPIKGQMVKTGETKPIRRNEKDHDTIGIIAINSLGNSAVGLTTNGADHKIAGRVGDSPLVGAGGYASDDGGAAVATGDGDTMLRFLPTFYAVQQMKSGVSPRNATVDALRNIHKYYPSFSGALVAANTQMEFSAACVGFSQFQYCVNNGNGTQTITISCENF